MKTKGNKSMFRDYARNMDYDFSITKMKKLKGAKDKSLALSC